MERGERLGKGGTEGESIERGERRGKGGTEGERRGRERLKEESIERGEGRDRKGKYREKGKKIHERLNRELCLGKSSCLPFPSFPSFPCLGRKI